MLRALLSLALLAVVAGLGFYAGRVTNVEPVYERDAVASIATPRVSPTVPQPETAARGRSVEPPPSPPEVVPSLPLAGPRALPSAELPLTPLTTTGDGSPLMTRNLTLPISGLKRDDIQDTFTQSRAAGERIHEATDIMSPRGTPVVAVDNGIIAKLFTSKPGGLTIYQFDSNEKFCFYYAHLDRYVGGLREGLLVKRGDTIGYVGSTGNADPNAPHLHFAIFELGPEKRWWEGKPINPYPILMRAFR
jgi:murein DD-endopeptidase MepM/ murein hydrolase activator NlpD